MEPEHFELSIGATSESVAGKAEVPLLETIDGHPQNHH